MKRILLKVLLLTTLSLFVRNGRVAANPVDTANFSVIQTDVTCYNGNNGSISITPTQGTGPFSFAWSNGDSTSTITNLAAGIYDLTVTDATGATAGASMVVNQPAPFSVTNAITNETCGGQSIGVVNISEAVQIPVILITGATGILRLIEQALLQLFIISLSPMP
jgi:hypothetical protein